MNLYQEARRIWSSKPEDRTELERAFAITSNTDFLKLIECQRQLVQEQILGIDDQGSLAMSYLEWLEELQEKYPSAFRYLD